jgi:hypothetical protein
VILILNFIPFAEGSGEKEPDFIKKKSKKRRVLTFIEASFLWRRI